MLCCVSKAVVPLPRGGLQDALHFQSLTVNLYCQRAVLFNGGGDNLLFLQALHVRYILLYVSVKALLMGWSLASTNMQTMSSSAFCRLTAEISMTLVLESSHGRVEQLLRQMYAR